MAHLDPVSGQWVEDDNGPVPMIPDAGSIGAQDSPALPPVLPQPPPAPPRALIKSEDPIVITPNGPETPPMPPPRNVIRSEDPITITPGGPEDGAPPPSGNTVTPLPGAPGLPPAPTPALPAASTPPGARPQIVTSQKLMGPENVAALENVDKANAAIRTNTAAAGDIGVQKATQASQQADQLLAVQQAQADARQKVQVAFERQQAIDNANIAQARADGLKDPDAGESWTHRLLRAIAIGMGQYAAAMTHTENMAATIFANDRKEKRQAQVDKLNAAKEAGQLTQTQYRDQMAALDAKDVGQIQAFKARWQAESAKLGIPQARIDANINTLALDKQEAEARAKLLNEDRVTVRDETPKELKEGKGGGGNNLAAEAKVAKAIQDGMSPADVRALSASLGLKGQRTDALENQGRAAAKAGTGGVDTKLLVHDVDGNPVGLASTSRAVPQVQKDLRTLPRAIEQLKQLRDYADKHMVTSPSDPRFHNAVLAVAATTSAGSTDANVAHEKGTLTNVLGLPSTDSIDRKIAELENQLAATQNQLEPLPEGYQPAPRPSLPDKARAAKAVMSGEPAPRGGPPPAKAPKVPADVIERAKEEVRKNGPHAASAKAMLDQQGIDVL